MSVNTRLCLIVSAAAMMIVAGYMVLSHSIGSSRRIARRDGGAPRRSSPDALRALAGYDRPGNVRELQNELGPAVPIRATP